MSARLLRPRASGVHPEASAWRSAVVANGGTVSASTLTAVSKFCAAIDSAGIRDRFFRLNLFCGTGLSAVLVPLYRGPSSTGTRYGGTTDTNVNFVSGDYVETGSAAGLTGNGSNKRLDTGLLLNALPSATSGHAAVYCPNRSSRTSFTGMLGEGIGAGTGFGISTDTNVYGIWGAFSFASNSTNGMLSVSRTSSTLQKAYVNGSAIATTTSTVTPTLPATQASVFVNRSGATFANYDSRIYCGYSLGIGMNDDQMAAYYTALQAFQTALKRNV